MRSGEVGRFAEICLAATPNLVLFFCFQLLRMVLRQVAWWFCLFVIYLSVILERLSLYEYASVSEGIPRHPMQ
jgi:hypothetical protein